MHFAKQSKSKKNIAILLVVAMLLTIMPVAVFAAGEEGGSESTTEATSVTLIGGETTIIDKAGLFNVTAQFTTAGTIQWAIDDVAQGDAVSTTESMSEDGSTIYTVTLAGVSLVAEQTITATLTPNDRTEPVVATGTVAKETVIEETTVAMIGDVQYETLQEAINNAKNGDTVTVLKDITGGVEISTKEITDLTIDLNDNSITATSDIAHGKCIMVMVVSDTMKNLTVQNGTLKGANAKGVRGGAISCEGDLTVKNCTFENNMASTGAAIAVTNFQKPVDLTVDGCTFENNKAVDGAGGAIGIWKCGQANISNCTFTNNSGYSMGGAIYVDHGAVVLDNNTFTSNTANYGGAIAGAETTITIKNSGLSKNGSAYYGGAIYIQNTGDNKSNLNISMSTLKENNTGYNGGAIYATGCDQVVVDGIFDSNRAGYDGGAVCVVKSNATLKGDYTNNKANRNGGVAYLQQYSMNVTGNYKNNTAGECGGAFYNIWSPLEFSTETVVTGNTAKIGGAIYNADNTFGENFNSKIIVNEGAAIHNNTATEAADDIYNGAEGCELKVPNAANFKAVLNSDKQLIDGWYDDSKDMRWNVTAPTLAENHAVLVDTTNTIEKEASLKAAHAVICNTLIQGTVFEDGTRNDALDANEFKFEGINVKLLKDGKVIATKKTDANGYYKFGDIDFGTYTVEIEWPEKNNDAMDKICAVNDKSETGNKFAAGADKKTAVSKEVEISKDNLEATLNAGFYNTTGGGGTITPNPDPEPPTTDPEKPPVEITDPDVPLVEPEDPTTEIDEPDVPLVEPGTPVEPPVEEIDEPEVPLGDAPKTGDAAPIVGLVGLLIVAVAGLVVTRRKFN